MDNTYIKQNLKDTLIEKLPIKKLCVIGLVGLTLSACNVTMGTHQSASEGIGFRQARFVEMSAMKAWRDIPVGISSRGIKRRFQFNRLHHRRHKLWEPTSNRIRFFKGSLFYTPNR